MDVATALGRYLEVVDSCAPGLVEGLYVVGSFALGDWHEGRSDIDIVAITAEPATDDDAASLVTAHAVLAEQQPTPSIDGPYVAWGDLITPSMGLHRPWSLEGRLHHDGDCFELNPVTWYTLATYGVTVRGPSVDRLGIYVDVDARARFCADNLLGYWRSLSADLIISCDTNPLAEFDPASFEWCALGALRLHYTAFRGGVVSKTEAGAYGLEVAPARFHSLLDEAIAVRQGAGPRDAIDTLTMRDAAELIAWCAQQAATALDQV
ncbi:MAG: nucleotidyltransferase domain-containing protein [Actinomycetota bacterium]